MHPVSKILRLSIAVLLVVMLGTAGYHYIEGWNWLDSLFMTSITITTVGYGETHPLDTAGQIFTIFLLLTSVGTFAYSLTAMASLVMEAQFGTLLWRRRMDAKIDSMKDHFIVCGFGRTGSSVCEPLRQSGRDVIVIEGEGGHLEELRRQEIPFVEGDATHDESLKRAGIERAKGLVAALGDDAENVYLVLSARQLNPNLTIVAWASSAEAERKVTRAGANHAMSPYVQGGIRITHMLTAPHALEFLDHAMGMSDSMRLGEIEVRAGSRAVGHTLAQLGMRRDLGVIVIGIRRADGTLEFNPGATALLAADDVLIGMGRPEQIDKLRDLV